ncbi:hypothetical protein SDC9_13750 [bioreactor metagenome]|uniref:Uncharacterized protein n=1 Tax=bioreactor metagenome TaxID=1076179 RepID=A0A644TNP5_9ZZZZ|nr:hypothetical protein [Negativicutes bacterium]
MISFIIGVCIGYFCRPFVALIIDLITHAWAIYKMRIASDGV